MSNSEGAVLGSGPSKASTASSSAAASDSKAAASRLMSGYRTLADMQEQFMYFTIAPMFVRGGLDFDPVTQFWEEVGDADVRRLVIGSQFNKPLFRGLGVLDSTLWLCAKQYWEKLLDKLQNMSWASTPRRELYLVEPGTAMIPDPLELSGRPATIYVTTFGVTGNKARYGFNTESPPRLVSLPVDPQVEGMANHMFGAAG